MNVRRFSRETQRNYIRDVGRFATFLRRSPDTATADDIRRFQIEQRDLGVPTPTMNSIVSALRFFFTHTIDRPDLARKLIAHTQKCEPGARFGWPWRYPRASPLATPPASLHACADSCLSIVYGRREMDTRNPTSKLILTILAGVATWERDVRFGGLA